MSDILRKYLINTVAHARASEGDSSGGDEGSSPVGILELEDSLDEATKPPELRQNRYLAEVQGVEEKTSGTSGNVYYAVKFLIPPEEIGADQRDDYPDGAVLYWNRQLKPKPGDRRAIFNLKKFMEALGLDTHVTSVDVNSWMGCRARLKVGQKPWDGEMRAQIDAVEAAEEGEGRREQEDKAPARGKAKAASGGRRGR